MPIYEYACPSCSATEERLEALSASSSHDCPSCGAADGMRRRLSVVSVASGSPEAGASGRPSTPCGSGGCGCPYAS